MSCAFCSQSLGETFQGRHLCPACGKPQPKGEDETYFSALGVPEKFNQDQALLQKRFYELSRLLHPDRFVREDESLREISLERMSFLNEAYRTLKTPSELRDYILAIHSSPAEPAKKSQIPLELAESWFELQDTLADAEPAQSAEQLRKFEDELMEFETSLGASIREKESQYDVTAPNEGLRKTLLNQLSGDIQKAGYLTSMKRDVARIKSN